MLTTAMVESADGVACRIPGFELVQQRRRESCGITGKQPADEHSEDQQNSCLAHHQSHHGPRDRLRGPCGCRFPPDVARPCTTSRRRGRWRQSARPDPRRIPRAWPSSRSLSSESAQLRRHRLVLQQDVGVALRDDLCDGW